MSFTRRRDAHGRFASGGGGGKAKSTTTAQRGRHAKALVRQEHSLFRKRKAYRAATGTSSLGLHGRIHRHAPRVKASIKYLPGGKK
jgi:hypothetical protein